MKLDELLQGRQVRFERLHHEPVYGANRVAEKLHVPGKGVAKTVLLRTELGYVIAVVPADHCVDLERVRACLGDEWVEMASEAEMRQLFPDCEVGAMPPFGSVYHLRTLVDEALADADEIVFEGQSHCEAIRMGYRDYDALEQPLKGRFSLHL
jgi:Ala-tRNA(Pro) deacylase